jgi:hypothetical protein
MGMAPTFSTKVFMFKTPPIAKKVVFCRIVTYSPIFLMKRGEKVHQLIMFYVHKKE